MTYVVSPSISLNVISNDDCGMGQAQSVRSYGDKVLKIRRAASIDEEVLTTIRRSAILTLAVPTLSVAQAETWVTQTATDRIVRAIREHEVWVAVEERVIGWVEVDQDRVAALYVSPSCSGRGVGSALLVRAERSIWGSGYPVAFLYASQNALAFYLRRGYLHYSPPDGQGAHPLRKALVADSLVRPS